jgi:DNA ligase 1
VFAFDLLYLNGVSLLKETLMERRAKLQANFVENNIDFMFTKYKNAEAFEDIESFLNESIKDCCEGLMIKTLD